MPQPVAIEMLALPDSEWLSQVRRYLRKAMNELQLMPQWREYYPDTPGTPAHLVKAGTCSISINGKLVWKARQETPAFEYILQQIQGANKKRSFSWKRALKNHLSFLMAILIAFFPKCPLCWAAYMSLLGSWGIQTIPYKPWLLPVFCILLLVNIVSLYLTGKKHHYLPLAFSIAGALLVISNRYYFHSQQLMYTGAALLIISSLWNTLPVRIINSIRHYFSGRKLVSS